jgi:hypothetical protein
MAQRKIAGIRWVNKRELRKVLHARAKRVLGLSGAAFQKHFSSGKLGAKNLDGTSGTLDLATLCSFTGGKRAGSKRKRSR